MTNETNWKEKFKKGYKKAIVDNKYSDKEEFDEWEDGYALKWAIKFIESEVIPEIRREELSRISKEIQPIINNSKATFFVQDLKIEIPAEEQLYELQAEISNNVGVYFIKQLDQLPPNTTIV